tara:strand:- start:2135 stop:3106 length:972 start_codon:yes stop_codon:yes gene_type:complete
MINIDINTSISDLTKLLKNHNILFENEVLSCISKAGEGNMNVVLRVRSNKRSFIFKQSRPFVQKFRDIQAPIERVDVEFNFYKAVNQNNNKSFYPKIISYVKENFFMILEDLGEFDDYTSIYRNRSINEETIIRLTRMLKDIHSTKTNLNYPLNIDLKKLNYQHIFVLPFIKQNGFSLDSVHKGLNQLAIPLIDNKALQNKSLLIGKRYLTKGKTLLHGDFYPGSWIKSQNKIFIIDPEFSFLGDLEFDLGVFIAHIIMATQKQNYLKIIIDYYSKSVDEKLVADYACIEIIRRLIGLAQLPINLTLDEKEKLLKFANNLLLK